MEKGQKLFIYTFVYFNLSVLSVANHEGSLFSANFVACMSTKILLTVVMMKCFISSIQWTWCMAVTHVCT